MAGGRLLHALDEAGVRAADAQAAAFREQTAALPLLQVVPTLVGSLQQRHVIRMRIVRFPDDARPAVTAAPVVTEGKLLKAQHAPAAPSQLECRRRTHAADAKNDHVVSAVEHGSLKGMGIGFAELL